ncbi:MAG: hypothetical protein HC937_01725 [Aquincola sp.]|nr:hypothetical protein [Aquincola sp.]
MPDAGTGTATERRFYDRDAQLTRVERADGRALDFVYDPTTRKLTSLTSPRGQTDFGYHAATGQLASIREPEGQVVSQSFDGPLLTRLAWQGEVTGSVERIWDNDLRVTSLKVNGADSIAFSYDDDSLLTSAGALTIAREAMTGREKSTTLGLITTDRTYTSFGEPETMTVKQGETEIYFEHLTYNKVGWVTDLLRRTNGASTTQHFEYDLRGRLTETWTNGALESSYDYDANSNRLNYEGPLGNATGSYDARDRMMSYGPATFTYRESGEVLTKTEASQTTSYDFDVFGNLRRVTCQRHRGRVFDRRRAAAGRQGGQWCPGQAMALSRPTRADRRTRRLWQRCHEIRLRHTSSRA